MISLEKINDYKWMIPKQADMRVPAYVFASEMLVNKMQDDETLIQLRNVASLPGIYKNALCMPDGHQGYGFPIGGVAALDVTSGGISPGGIGYDINCGVRLLRTNLTEKDVIKVIPQLISSLYGNIPSGVGSEGKLGKSGKPELIRILEEGASYALSKGYATEEDLRHTEENGCLDADASKVSERALARGNEQSGSLGAGNHFLEVQKVEKIFDPVTAKAFGIESEGQVCVMIHCGSRGLGHQVCSDYLREMEKANPGLVKTLPDRELIYAPSGSLIANDYFKAMNAAANYAWYNRQIIAYFVRKSFETIFKKSSEALGIQQVYDVCHNICKIEEYDGKKFYVHRKGATRCMPKGHKLVPDLYKSVGQPAIIPGTMGTGSYVVVGMPSCISESFASTAHGAGRTMSRHEASREITGEQLQNELNSKGIYLKTRNLNSVVDEAPSAYKDVDEVVRVSELAGITKRVVKLKPLGVIKG